MLASKVRNSATHSVLSFKAIAEWSEDLLISIATITINALLVLVYERAESAAQLLSSHYSLSESEIEPLWFQEVAHWLLKWIKACPDAFLQRKCGGKPIPYSGDLLLSRSCAS